jgi:hypothetical protein
MTELSSYVFSELREGELTLYRGSCGGRDPILLVVSEQEYSARETVKRLEHKYKHRTTLATVWAARPVALPANILLDIASGGVWLTDFGMACLLPSAINTYMELSISRRINEDHHGTLWATPNEDNGISIQFAFPTDRGREL